MVHGAAGEERADRDALGSDLPIGEDDQTVALVDRLFRLCTDAIQGPRESVPPLGLRPGDVDRACLPAAVIDVLERRELLVAENRMRHAQPVRVLLGRLQQIQLRPDVTVHRHDDLLADRIDGRIRDLREELLEVVVDHAWLVGETGQRRVVAHRAHRIA